MKNTNFNKICVYYPKYFYVKLLCITNTHLWMLKMKSVASFNLHIPPLGQFTASFFHCSTILVEVIHLSMRFQMQNVYVIFNNISKFVYFDVSHIILFLRLV